MKPKKLIESLILTLREQRVMLDRDLAVLYGVETRVLNQAVSRNRERFPADFMLELTRKEIMRISQIVTSSAGKLRRDEFASVQTPARQGSTAK